MTWMRSHPLWTTLIGLAIVLAIIILLFVAFGEGSGEGGITMTTPS